MNPSQEYQKRLDALQLTKLNQRTTERHTRCETGTGHRYRDDRTLRRYGMVMHVCTRCRVPAIVDKPKNELAHKNAKQRVAKRWNGPITPAHKPARAA